MAPHDSNSPGLLWVFALLSLSETLYPNELNASFQLFHIAS